MVGWMDGWIAAWGAGRARVCRESRESRAGRDYLGQEREEGEQGISMGQQDVQGSF